MEAYYYAKLAQPQRSFHGLHTSDSLLQPRKDAYAAWAALRSLDSALGQKKRLQQPWQLGKPGWRNGLPLPLLVLPPALDAVGLVVLQRLGGAELALLPDNGAHHKANIEAGPTPLLVHAMNAAFRHRLFPLSVGLKACFAFLC